MLPITSTARPSPPPAPAAWPHSMRTVTSRRSTRGSALSAPASGSCSLDQAAVTDSIDTLAAAEWNALGADAHPFMRHEFLAALEHSGCVGAGGVWEPRSFTQRDARGLRAAAPAYLKRHSYGEFVFDFAWA